MENKEEQNVVDLFRSWFTDDEWKEMQNKFEELKREAEEQAKNQQQIPE